MTSKKSSKQSQPTLSEKREGNLTPIIVAVIGLMGVAITAVCGFLGILVTRPDKEIPLSAAQSDWLSLIDFQFGWDEAACGQQVSYVVPDYITLKEGDPASLKGMEDISAKVPVAPWPIMDQEMQWGITITNKSSSPGDWIRIDKQMTVRLEVVSKDVAKHVSLWKVDGVGCGGGEYKVFSPIRLTQAKNSINQTITSDKYDYFSFEPGEFDTFVFEFVCAAPGLYRPTVEMSVSYKGEDKVVTLMGDELVLCPETFSLWTTDYSYYSEAMMATQESRPITRSPMSYSGEFRWNGTSYKPVP